MRGGILASGTFRQRVLSRMKQRDTRMLQAIGLAGTMPQMQRNGTQFNGPTIIPRNAPGVQRNPQSCVVCWKVVPAWQYDFDNEMCKGCSKALIPKPETNKAGTI